MSEMLSPLQWQDAELTPSTPLAREDKIGEDPFAWPVPPYLSYPPAMPQTEPLPCVITGLNHSRTSGQLTSFVPDEEVAHVQVPPARTTLQLRFEQFQSLTLTTPLKPLAAVPDDPHAQVLGLPKPVSFRIVLTRYGELRGETLGHVETAFGLFIFPPQGDDGAVLRRFVPRAAYEHVEFGARIGEELVAQAGITPQQVASAIDVQNEMRSQKLGEILLMRRSVSPEQLLEAIERQARMPMVRIGEALVSLGMVSEQQIQDALLQQESDRSVPLGEVLVRMGVVSHADLQVALSRKMGYPLVDLDSFAPEAEALRKVPFAMAVRLRLMPLLVRDGRLIVALDDPARRRTAVEEVEFSAQMKVFPVLSQCRELDELLFAAYERIGASPARRPRAVDTLEPIELDMPDSNELVDALEKEGQAVRVHVNEDAPIEQSDNSLVRLINSLVIEAHREGVSDIHIESYPGREKIRVRFRKDGQLRTHIELPSNYRNAVIGRIKIMCDLDISERRKPQDGKINFAKFSAQHKIELRVATIPTNSGMEDVVMRILASAKPIPLDRLGLADHNLAELKRAVARPYGLVLCVGPTGSGKTTTLHSALSHINVPERKIWTAEDPVEITQPGLRQVQVNPKIDWTFAKALRAFLRADPDVIMVGEIRDAETGHMAVEASLTGHLVMSTLHTNSAPETVTRLLDMGLDPFNFADSLLAVLAQRLVRRLCSECRVSRDATDSEVEELLNDYMHAFGAGDPPVSRDSVHQGWLAQYGRNGRLQMHHGSGCKKCDKTGFRGRAGLHELMVVSRGLRRLVQTGARAEALQELALREGMRTLRQDGIDKVLAGHTSIEEVRAISNS